MRSLDRSLDDEISRIGILCWKVVGIGGQFETRIKRVNKPLLVGSN